MDKKSQEILLSYTKEEYWFSLEEKATISLLSILRSNEDVAESYGINEFNIDSLEFRCSQRKIHIGSFGLPEFALSVTINAAFELKEKMFFDPLISYELLVNLDLEYLDEFLG